MKSKIFFAASCPELLLALTTPAVFACGTVIPNKSETLARQAVSTDTNVAARAIAALRAQGPAGLDALLLANSELLRTHEASASLRATGALDSEWDRLRTAIDAVSGQRDCS